MSRIVGLLVSLNVIFHLPPSKFLHEPGPISLGTRRECVVVYDLLLDLPGVGFGNYTGGCGSEHAAYKEAVPFD